MEKREIKFFEKEEQPSDTHTACGTPNPPWWCGEEPNKANIDNNMFLIALVIIGIILMFKQRQ